MLRREPDRALQPVVALDAAVLDDLEIALGGATRIALAFGEARILGGRDTLARDLGISDDGA